MMSKIYQNLVLGAPCQCLFIGIWTVILSRQLGCYLQLSFMPSTEERTAHVFLLQNERQKAKREGEEGVPPTPPAHPARVRDINTNACSICAPRSEKDEEYLS